MGLKYYLRGLGVGIVVTALIMGIAAGVDSGEVLSDDEIRERARGLGMVEESTVLSDTFAQGSLNSTIGEISAEEEPESLSASDGEIEETEEQEEDAEASSLPEEEEKESDSTEKEDAESQMEKAVEASAVPEKTAEAKTPEPSASAEKTEAPTATPAATLAPTAAPTETPAPTQAPEPTSAPEPETQQEESVTIQIVSGDSSLAVCKKLAQAGLVESASAYDAYLCQNGYDKRIRAGAFEIPVGATGEEIAGIILKLK